MSSIKVGNDCIFLYQYLVTATVVKTGNISFHEYLVTALIQQWRREMWRLVPSTCFITREDGKRQPSTMPVPSNYLISSEDGKTHPLFMPHQQRDVGDILNLLPTLKTFNFLIHTQWIFKKT